MGVGEEDFLSPMPRRFLFDQRGADVEVRFLRTQTRSAYFYSHWCRYVLTLRCFH